jgi:predicted methyltransferase
MTTRLRAILPALAIATVAAALFTGALAQGTPDYAAIVAASDRIDADRDIDKRRDPAKLLAFTGARPGMNVLDIGAGGGYSTELMARAVAPNGKVYAQNPVKMFPKAKERFDARTQRPAFKNVTALFRPFDDPIPAEVRDLDLITFFFYYHDISYMEVDRAAMNKKLFAALKPGGVMVVADHSAAAGAGISVGKSLHRIEEIVVRNEVQAAGFKLVGEADFLRQAGDKRDFSVNKPTGPIDEFILKFQRPK